jgi:hypothetical protein
MSKLTFTQRFCAFLFLSVLVLRCSAAPRKTAKDPVVGDRISKAIVFEGELWLRGGDIGSGSGLISLNVSDASKRVRYKNGVVDIEKAGGELWVLRYVSTDKKILTVSIWSKDDSRDLPEFEALEEDAPICLLSAAGAPVVLSRQGLRTFSTQLNRWQKIHLNGELRGGVQVAAASPKKGDSIYLGFNRGEWGGGLQRVNLSTGAVTNVERRDTKELCAGPLNSDCDPVTGVVADAEHSECVLISIGLVHLGFSHGRILRVCGDEVSEVWEKMARGGWDNQNIHEAVFGLASLPDGRIWAITWRALYLISADGKEQRDFELPKLKKVAGIYLNTDLPGVIVLRTDVNWAVSTSGYTPLLAPLESGSR